MFNKKNDPLVGVITGIVNDTARRNEAERKVNETFGVYSRKALPHERQAEYDAALAQAQIEVLNEEEEELDETAQQLDELSKETLKSYLKKNEKLAKKYGASVYGISTKPQRGASRALDRLGGSFTTKTPDSVLRKLRAQYPNSHVSKFSKKRYDLKKSDNLFKKYDLTKKGK